MVMWLKACYGARLRRPWLIIIIIKRTFQSRLLIYYHGDTCSERQTTKLKSQFLEGEYIVYEIVKKYVFKCFLKVLVQDYY